MKKILNKYIHILLMSCLTAICILYTSCKNDTIGSPVITGVRNYVASPNDTILPGAVAKAQWVVIQGKNLQNALQISFDGVPATFNSALFAPNSAVVQIPPIIFSTIDMNKLYTIEYVTSDGSTRFSFKLGPAAPTITAISNVFANPGDSVYVYGTDLFLVQSLSYGGATISSARLSFDGTAIGFKMPSPAPTSGEVSITTKSGTATFKIVALPTITGISNDNASPGDSVYVYGTYLKGIQSVTFSGATISSFVSATDGSSVAFIMPTITTSGPASITTSFGTATTAYNVYNIYNVQFVGVATTGVLANLEWGNAFGWSWWGGVKYTTGNTAWGGITDFNGVLGSSTNSQFAYFNSGIMNSGDGTSSWPGTYTFPIGAAQWIPTANLSDPVGNWAIQFEMSVAHPWNGSTLCFESGFAGNYVARYEPWQISASGTKAFSTKGWQTVTIPLSSFRAEDSKLGKGKGVSVASLNDLLGGTGNTGLNIYLHNFSTSPTATGFYAAFDNIRVVKIK
jgi:hypothetical protein